MKKLFVTSLLITMFIAGTSTSAQDAQLEPLEKIDPETYFVDKENRKIDPNDKILQGFRDRKIRDLADPEMPRPFSIDDYAREETIDSEVPWEDLSNIFRFDWDVLEVKAPDRVAQLSKAIRARVIFGSSDVKIIELAVAAGGILPAFSQPGPSAYHIIEGSAEFTSGMETANVFTGTSVKVESGENVRITVTSTKPLKALWFSWAPGGDQQYLSAGYYLTGSNFHIQPMDAEIPKDFAYWEKEKRHEVSAGTAGKDSSVGESLYPDAPTFRSEKDDAWLDFSALADGGFFWADDFKRMGSLMGVVNKIVRMKGVFRAIVPEKQYDFNVAYITWGPRSKYIMHSHATPEFYYILAGKTEWMLGGPSGNVYSAEPGNMYFHAPYLEHEMRGLSDESGQVAITGSWAPNGDRSVFSESFVLNEPLPMQEKSAVFPEDFTFNDFGDLKTGIEYGPGK